MKYRYNLRVKPTYSSYFTSCHQKKWFFPHVY